MLHRSFGQAKKRVLLSSHSHCTISWRHSFFLRRSLYIYRPELGSSATRSFWAPIIILTGPCLMILSLHFPLPPCAVPTYSDFYRATITSPNSVPGADDLLYSTWRVCSSISAQGLQQHFDDIISFRASPPLQSRSLSPKLTLGIMRITIDL